MKYQMESYEYAAPTVRRCPCSRGRTPDFCVAFDNAWSPTTPTKCLSGVHVWVGVQDVALRFIRHLRR